MKLEKEIEFYIQELESQVIFLEHNHIHKEYYEGYAAGLRETASDLRKALERNETRKRD